MITLKLNLRQLKHALMTTPKGAKVIVIPIVDNNLFEGKEGIYLDIVGFDYEDKTLGKQYPDTHLLKQSFKKEELAAMSEDQKMALPILGNARVASGTAHAEPAPKDLNNGVVAKGIDDLPF
jgi:hypothetical protein